MILCRFAMSAFMVFFVHTYRFISLFDFTLLSFVLWIFLSLTISSFLVWICVCLCIYLFVCLFYLVNFPTSATLNTHTRLVTNFCDSPRFFSGDNFFIVNVVSYISYFCSFLLTQDNEELPKSQRYSNFIIISILCMN